MRDYTNITDSFDLLKVSKLSGGIKIASAAGGMLQKVSRKTVTLDMNHGRKINNNTIVLLVDTGIRSSQRTSAITEY